MSRYAKSVLITGFTLFLISISETDSTRQCSSVSIFPGTTFDSHLTLPSFVQLGKKLYHFNIQNSVNWFEAAHLCREKQAYLASIDSQEEESYIRTFLADHFISNNFWIGANDLGIENEFRSLRTGKLLPYAFWGVSQQANHDDEDCVELRFKKDFRLFDMNIRGCTERNNFICEADVSTVIFQVW